MKPLKILIGTYPQAFQTPGGGEVQLMQTFHALKRMGHDPQFFDQWNPCLDGIDIFHFFSSFGGSWSLCHYVKSKGIPVAVSTVLYPNHPELYPIGDIQQQYSIADLLLPNSEDECHVLGKVFGVPKEKFFVVHNGIASVFIEKATTPLNVSFQKHFNIQGDFLLSVANVEPRKNQLALAKAVADLNLNIVLAGHVREQQYLEEVLSAGNGKIKYVGHIPHGSDLMLSAYRECRAFVLPSMLETPGLAALEAGVMGAPVLITQIGGTREYFGSYATYVDPTSVESIKDGLLDLLKINPTLEYRNAQIKSLSQWSWDNTAIECVSAYQKILQRNLGV